MLGEVIKKQVLGIKSLQFSFLVPVFDALTQASWVNALVFLIILLGAIKNYPTLAYFLPKFFAV